MGATFIRRIVKIILTRISPKLETTFNYRYTCGEWLDWNNPKDINAKLQWLKINTYYDNPEITMCIDKYKIREWLKKHGHEELLPILYGVYDSPEEIEWENLPNSFAIKCNHSCGANIIVSEKNELNIEEAKMKLKKWMKEDYWITGEVQYKFIEKKIIIEEYLGNGDNLKTYKFFCFNGEPKVLYISMDEDKFINYYDMDFNKLPYKLLGHENFYTKIDKPKNFNQLVEIAKQLSSHFPFVRVDLYDSFGKIFISELTFIPTGGFMKLDPPDVLREWGEWLELPIQRKS